MFILYVKKNSKRIQTENISITVVDFHFLDIMWKKLV